MVNVNMVSVDLEAERAASLRRIETRKRQAIERARERMTPCDWKGCSRVSVFAGRCNFHLDSLRPKPKRKPKSNKPRAVVETLKSIRQHYDGSAAEYVERQREIIKRYDAGETFTAIGKRFGIARGAVRNTIQRRDRWNDPAFISALLA